MNETGYLSHSGFTFRIIFWGTNISLVLQIKSNQNFKQKLSKNTKSVTEFLTKKPLDYKSKNGYTIFYNQSVRQSPSTECYTSKKVMTNN